MFQGSLSSVRVFYFWVGDRSRSITDRPICLLLAQLGCLLSRLPLGLGVGLRIVSHFLQLNLFMMNFQNNK